MFMSKGQTDNRVEKVVPESLEKCYLEPDHSKHLAVLPMTLSFFHLIHAPRFMLATGGMTGGMSTCGCPGGTGGGGYPAGKAMPGGGMRGGGGG